jgi:hypothetical protein
MILERAPGFKVDVQSSRFKVQGKTGKVAPDFEP